jgi:hypothetical protein
MDQARPPDNDRSIGQRASDLQLQVEHVSLALQQLRQTQDSLRDMEQRLQTMTEECSRILEQWEHNDQKHATAVAELHSRLSEWNDIERRLLNESTTRIHQFERNLQHEWTAIRQAHEEPIRQLDQQTARITETCLTAVDQALRGFDRAEARLQALEQQFQQQVGDLTREVRDALAELRLGVPAPGARQPWALDNVVRLHNELRADAEAAGAPAFAVAGSSLGLSVAPGAARGALALAGPFPAESGGDTRAPEPAESSAHLTVEPAAVPLWRRPPVVAALVATLVIGAFAVYLQTEVRRGLDAAAARAEAAERGARETREQARREITAAQQAADQRLAAAEQAAQSAQRLATILAAPDLSRFELANRAGDAAQVLWSRTQGVAFRSRHLPALSPGKTFDLWLLSPGRATRVGPIPVTADGAASAEFGPVPGLPAPVLGAILTSETEGTVATNPTGPAVLAGRPAPARTAGQ